MTFFDIILKPPFKGVAENTKPLSISAIFIESFKIRDFSSSPRPTNFIPTINQYSRTQITASLGDGSIFEKIALLVNKIKSNARYKQQLLKENICIEHIRKSFDFKEILNGFWQTGHSFLIDNENILVELVAVDKHGIVRVLGTVALRRFLIFTFSQTKSLYLQPANMPIASESLSVLKGSKPVLIKNPGARGNNEENDLAGCFATRFENVPLTNTLDLTKQGDQFVGAVSYGIPSKSFNDLSCRGSKQKLSLFIEEEARKRYDLHWEDRSEQPIILLGERNGNPTSELFALSKLSGRWQARHIMTGNSEDIENFSIMGLVTDS